MCTLCQSLDPTISEYDSHGLSALTASGAGGHDELRYDGGSGGMSISAGLPVYSYDQVADYLTDGFWQDRNTQSRAFDVETGGTLTFNIDGLNTAGKEAAVKALEAWTQVTGLNFQTASKATADMVFDDNNSGAYASSSVISGVIQKSTINVDDGWVNYGDYYLQTYIHEIGHALGLGHTGSYNGSADFGRDAHFANDSWQVSIMSYFDNRENPNTNASHLYLATAQLGDIAAVHDLYGTPVNVSTGNTVYGLGTNSTQFGMDLSGNYGVAIFDSGGVDHINLSNQRWNQVINLGEETFSNINGRIGNLSIARDTIIENVTTGDGADEVNGNGADNQLSSGAGDDRLVGQGGNDVLTGGAGADVLTGGSGADTFAYGALGDAGDTIMDLSLSDGDRVDISALLDAIGYGGTDPVADGIVSLESATGGLYLVIDADGGGSGAGVRLAFITGLDPSTDVADLIDTGGTPPTPPTGGGGNDTTYYFTDTFINAWTASRSLVVDSDGGVDTLDLTAIDAVARITLESGVQSRIGSKKLSIQQGTQIENILFAGRNDQGTGNELDNYMSGGAGNDRLYGLGGDDELDGGVGADRIEGGEGDDDLTGGEGNDRLEGDAGDDTLDGGAGNDRLEGGDGNDTIDAGEGRDAVYAGGGDDVVTTGLGDDRVYGGAGDDEMTGGAGRDFLRGEEGDDTLNGGDDDDRLFSGAGDDVVDGGAGNDFIKTEDGNDTVTGGAGNDRIYAGIGDDTVTAGDGNDYIKGNLGDDVLDAGEGNNLIYAGEGNDSLTAGDGDDYLRGDAGHDILNAGHGDNRLMSGVGDDVLISGDGIDYLKADAGDDVLSSGGGNDRVYGDDGDDEIDAGAGDDYAKGGKGDDTIDGGAGDDKIYSDQGSDIVDAGDGADYVKAGDDNDVIDGGAGNDKIYGDSGEDIVRGGAGDDTLYGGSGNDEVYGGSGADIIDAGSGDDRVFGGSGADTLKGGSGTDVFVFMEIGDIGDTITDFALRYEEKIELSTLFTAMGLTVEDAIADGMLSLVEHGRGSWLELDQDGVGGNDPLQLVYLSRMSDDTEISTDWLI